MARKEPVEVSRGGGAVSRSNLPNEPAVPTSEAAEGGLTGGTLPARAGLVNLILLDRLQRVEAALGVSRGGPALAIPIAQGALDELLDYVQSELDTAQRAGRKQYSNLQVAAILVAVINQVNRGRQALAQAAEQASAPEEEARQ